MKIALLAYGSRGDIQPVLAVADALKSRGHGVRMTVNTSSASWAKDSGIELFPMPPDIEAFWKSQEGQGMLASGKTMRFLKEISALERKYDDEVADTCARACEGTDVIISTIGTAYRAAALQELLGLPHACLCPAPLMRTSDFAGPLSPVRDLGMGFLNRSSWDLLYAAYWFGQKGLLNGVRGRWGLPAWKSRPKVEQSTFINLFSRHLVPLPKDAPANHHQVGQPTLSPELRKRLGEGIPPQGLDDWLAAGPPPVFFGFGSMPVMNPSALLQDIRHMCEEHSIRALIGAGWSDYEPSELSDAMFMVAAFDHDRVLPRCRAAVHHGGAGTTQSALRAGLPSLVCSLMGDQLFWGWRVQQLGAGATFRYQDLNRARLSAALSQVLRPEAAERAKKIGEGLRAEDGSLCAAETIEAFASGTLN